MPKISGKNKVGNTKSNTQQIKKIKINFYQMEDLEKDN